MKAAPVWVQLQRSLEMVGCGLVAAPAVVQKATEIAERFCVLWILGRTSR